MIPHHVMCMETLAQWPTHGQGTVQSRMPWGSCLLWEATSKMAPSDPAPANIQALAQSPPVCGLDLGTQVLRTEDTGVMLPSRLEGRILCLLQLWWLRAFLGLWPHNSSLCLYTASSSSLCLLCLLQRHQSLDLGLPRKSRMTSRSLT